VNLPLEIVPASLRPFIGAGFNRQARDKGVLI